MKTKKFFAMLMALVMVLSLAACGGKEETPADAPAQGEELHLGANPATGEEAYGPYYDEWSDMTDEELYELALKEDTTINIYATSSKMLKEEEPFEEMYPGLDLVVSDLDSDEVLNKAKIENETGNITADVLQSKDVNGSVFYEYYGQGVVEPFYPRDICENIDEENLKYCYPLYSSQSFWYYNTEAFPDGQPIHSCGRSLRRIPTEARSIACSPRRSVRRLLTCLCLPASSTMLTRWLRTTRRSTARNWSTPMTPLTLLSRFPRTTPALSICGASASVT